MTVTDEQMRNFERFPLDFNVDVRGVTVEGERFCDHGHLENVSGGGLCIHSEQSHRYTIGQIVDLSLQLPATERQKPVMSSRAKVAWVHPLEPDPSRENAPAQIGITLIDCFSFQNDMPAV